jgi:cell division protein FtsW (lipid II flippase)
LFARGSEIFAAACGFATMTWVLVVRRLGLGLWTRAALAILAIAAAAFVVSNQLGQAGYWLPLRFAASPPSTLTPLAQRLLAETPWAGSGAGTFAALVPIYRGGEEVAVSATAPTTAADFAIELGWPALCAFVLIMLFVAVLLMRGALQRGRDSFHATAAGGCAVLITVEAFCDPSLEAAAASSLAAVLLGLGIAQSVSRSLQ